MLCWAVLERQIVPDCLSLGTVQLFLWRPDYLGWMPASRMEIWKRFPIWGRDRRVEHGPVFAYGKSSHGMSFRTRL